MFKEIIYLSGSRAAESPKGQHGGERLCQGVPGFYIQVHLRQLPWTLFPANRPGKKRCMCFMISTLLSNVFFSKFIMTVNGKACSFNVVIAAGLRISILFLHIWASHSYTWANLHLTITLCSKGIYCTYYCSALEEWSDLLKVTKWQIWFYLLGYQLLLLCSSPNLNCLSDHFTPQKW